MTFLSGLKRSYFELIKCLFPHKIYFRLQKCLYLMEILLILNPKTSSKRYTNRHQTCSDFGCFVDAMACSWWPEAFRIRYQIPPGQFRFPFSGVSSWTRRSSRSYFLTSSSSSPPPMLTEESPSRLSLRPREPRRRSSARRQFFGPGETFWKSKRGSDVFN